MTLATVLLVALAVTQPPPPLPSVEAPRASDAPMAAPPLVSAAPETCSASAEADYDAGFNALVEGREQAALEAFERVQLACPQHPFASEFARLARTRLRPGQQLAEAATSVLGPETPSGGARASLTVVQTLHGATQGILLCAIAECEGRALVAVSLLGASLGSAGSLLLTERGLTSGQASAINSGTLWGFWFGIASLMAFELEGDAAIAAPVIGAAGLTGVGILLAQFVRPTAGQVSMANSGGLWAGVVMALLLATSDSSNSETFFAIELGTTAAGILSLGLLSHTFPVSRGRMLIIDAGAILGGLLGASVTYMAAADSGDAILVGTGVGVLAGLGTAAYLTRDFDAPEAPQATVVPSLMGREGAGVAVVGRF